jgi:hypothetical protein
MHIPLSPKTRVALLRIQLLLDAAEKEFKGITDRDDILRISFSHRDDHNLSSVLSGVGSAAVTDLLESSKVVVENPAIFHHGIVVVDVASEIPIDNMSLSHIASNDDLCTITKIYSQEINGADAAALLGSQGSEPGLFQLDDRGGALG